MGQFFVIHRPRHALSLTAGSTMTIDVPAGRKCKVHGVTAVGGDNAGANSSEVGVFRVTANGSGGSPTDIPIKPLDPHVSVPSGFSAKFGYTTPPTVEANPVIPVPFQPYGGQGSWPVVAGAPAEFWLVTAYQIAIHSVDTTGTDTPTASVSVLVELE